MNNADWFIGFPDEWRELRADFLCHPYREMVSPERFEGKLVAHYSIPQVQETGGPLIEPADDIDSAKLLIRQPTLLVSKLNPRKKTICIAEPQRDFPTLASGEFVPIQSEEFDQRYAFYVWSSDKVTDRLSAIVQSATRSHQRVNPADILKLPWKWPPLNIQKRIANFLDEKTGRFDALIAKKQTLLDRLAEKRQAIITQAVTKGLNPAAPMKQSGIEWLGQIPAHWEVKRLRYILDGDTRNGLYKPKDQFDEDGVPFVQMGEAFRDLRFVGGTKDRVISNPVEVCRWGLQLGDFLIARRSIVFEGSGKSVIIGPIEEPHLFESSMIRIRPLDPHFSTFLSYYFQSKVCRAFFLSITKQVTISGIDSQQLKDIVVPVPPEAEAAEISRYLEERERHIENLEGLTKGSIDRLDEYRATLISAAVTGQIEGLR